MSQPTANVDPEPIKNDTRDALLIVASLIASVTFQAGVNPPDRIWDGREGFIMMFFVCNTWALSASAYLILTLTKGISHNSEIRIAIGAMMSSYEFAIFAITDKATLYRYHLVVAWVPIGVIWLIEQVRKR
ncbi:hypothetical protein Nepgr_021555 [Nepenthes gracilis]|uniref:PGG domain-containing protein n=1 Tax=Nepenthes gracilis TaxID=150966 RepID=A0AAD3SZL2_NEPGR|nr:hypothetical protein Nepgr_021555 [Nepenthes gracilis]